MYTDSNYTHYKFEVRYDTYLSSPRTKNDVKNIKCKKQRCDKYVYLKNKLRTKNYNQLEESERDNPERLITTIINLKST